MSTDLTRPAKPRLSRTGIWLLIAGGVIVILAAAGLWMAFGASPRVPPPAAERPPVSAAPVVTDRITPPPAPAGKTYSEAEVQVIRELTRTQTLNEAALERQYGK